MGVTQEICKAFNAHAGEYETVAKIQSEIGERLFERLKYLKITPKYVLDLGCGTGLFLKRLQRQYPKAHVVGLDVAHHMLLQAQKKESWFRKTPLVEGDMSAMPFPDGTFDLVFANQVLHWSDSFSNVFSELSRVMNHNGCLMFSTLGPDTFLELNQAWSAADAYAHSNEFIDMHLIGDALLQECFLDPVVDMENIAVHYPTLPKLLGSLKAQGVKNVHPARRRGLMSRMAWHRFEQAFDALKTQDGFWPLTYEVVYGHAWMGQRRKREGKVESFISVEQLKKKSR